MSKVCKGCHENKPLNQYYNAGKRAAGGYYTQSQCRACCGNANAIRMRKLYVKKPTRWQKLPDDKKRLFMKMVADSVKTKVAIAKLNISYYIYRKFINEYSECTNNKSVSESTDRVDICTSPSQEAEVASTASAQSLADDRSTPIAQEV